MADGDWSAASCRGAIVLAQDAELRAPDLRPVARKLIRRSNLRILADGELMWAVRAFLTLTRHTRKKKRIPKQHSAVAFMRPWQIGGKEVQAQMAQQFGADQSDKPCLCSTGDFFTAFEALHREHKELGGGFGPAPNYMSPLMSNHAGKELFMQIIGHPPPRCMRSTQQRT